MGGKEDRDVKMEQLEYQYHHRSVPEFVLGTWLGRDDNGRLIACEGITIPVDSDSFVGWDYCECCPIAIGCFMRLSEVLEGGKL